MLPNEKNYMYGSAAPKIEYDIYEKNKVLKAKKRQKSNNKTKFRAIFTILIFFGVLFFIMFRYATITELNYTVSEKNEEYNKIRNQNSALKLEIQKGLDLNKVKDVAETRLGMQKPDKSQIVYVKVPKRDFTTVAEKYKTKTEEKGNVLAVLWGKVRQFTGLLN